MNLDNITLCQYAAKYGDITIMKFRCLSKMTNIDSSGISTRPHSLLKNVLGFSLKVAFFFHGVSNIVAALKECRWAHHLAIKKEDKAL